MITIADYLEQAQTHVDVGQYTDGCTTPFKNYIHKWLEKSHLLCAAHDFGSLGLIDGVRPGWHNNWVTWLAHMTQSNPIYWAWGTIIAIATLPWVVWRRNFGFQFLDMTGFYVIMLILIALPVLIYYQPGG